MQSHLSEGPHQCPGAGGGVGECRTEQNKLQPGFREGMGKICTNEEKRQARRWSLKGKIKGVRM